MQKISLSKADDQTTNLKTRIINKTEKQTSEETTQEESTKLSIIVESDTSSSSTGGNILKLNLTNTS